MVQSNRQDCHFSGDDGGDVDDGGDADNGGDADDGRQRRSAT